MFIIQVTGLPDDKKFPQMFQIIPRNRGFDKFYHTCEEIGRGTQGVTYFVQQAKKNSFTL
jgi:hypothetical protein